MAEILDSDDDSVCDLTEPEVIDHEPGTRQGAISMAGGLAAAPVPP